MSFKQKYLKYKSKYLEYKFIINGGVPKKNRCKSINNTDKDKIVDDIMDLISKCGDGHGYHDDEDNFNWSILQKIDNIVDLKNLCDKFMIDKYMTDENIIDFLSNLLPIFYNDETFIIYVLNKFGDDVLNKYENENDEGIDFVFSLLTGIFKNISKFLSLSEKLSSELLRFIKYLSEHDNNNQYSELPVFLTDFLKSGNSIRKNVFDTITTKPKSASYLYFFPDLLNDTNFIFKATDINIHILFHIPEKYMNDDFLKLIFKKYSKLSTTPEFIDNLSQKNKNALRYASKDLQDNRVIVLKAVKHYGLALRHASEKLKNDKEIVTEALTNDRDAWRYIPELSDLRNNNDILILAGIRDKPNTNLGTKPGTALPTKYTSYKR